MARFSAMSLRSRAAQATSAPQIGRLASAALLLSASFVLSRVLGVLRNVVIADIFGNSRAVEAYFAAFRIPDTMFMLVSGGALASALIPMFAGLLEHGEEREAWKIAGTVINTSCLALGAIALVAYAFTPLIMDVLVPGYTPSERALTVELTRIMLWQPIFLGVAAILMSILQTYHRFLPTAVAPLLYNLAVILGAWIFGGKYGVHALAWAVVIGAVAQFGILLPGLKSELLHRYRLSIDWSVPEAREVLRLFAPRVVGLAAFQLMMLITLFLASGLPPGNVAAINYSFPLVMFPIGALGTAAATAIFPTLSRLTAVEDLAAVRRTVNRALRMVLFVALPSSVGLLVLRRPLINLLFNHGQWTVSATEQTAFALLFFSLAVAPLAVVEVLPRVFYAMKDTVTPVRIAVAVVVLDAMLSVLFVNVLPRDSGQGGLALATAIASLAQALWLGIAVEKRLGGVGRRSLLLTVRDAGLASLVMGMVLYIALDPLTAVFAQHGWGALMTVAVELVLGLSTFVLTAHILGAPELSQVLAFVERQR
jgi:putative peptidoglycan lipid II flippase